MEIARTQRPWKAFALFSLFHSLKVQRKDRKESLINHGLAWPKRHVDTLSGAWGQQKQAASAAAIAWCMTEKLRQNYALRRKQFS
jgi:hypothetical protein